MIVQMFKELLILMVILAVFLVSSDVAMLSLLYPYRTEFNASVLLDVVYIPYYRIYGEVNLDESNGMFTVNSWRTAMGERVSPG
ncbi:unnamed protein product [Dibothriocephalus latus]|uniref:Uncharacterized protein n=1 Tax=Dibothriocephalus latus TaxID=60516 RepID=A0A3P7LRJ0_DIBLA|nr:unnamed protein product [Dibothriocephalus latus]